MTRRNLFETLITLFTALIPKKTAFKNASLSGRHFSGVIADDLIAGRNEAWAMSMNPMLLKFRIQCDPTAALGQFAVLDRSLGSSFVRPLRTLDELPYVVGMITAVDVVEGRCTVKTKGV